MNAVDKLAAHLAPPFGEAEDAVDAIIGLLDAAEAATADIEPDCDLEPDEDMPQCPEG